MSVGKGPWAYRCITGKLQQIHRLFELNCKQFVRDGADGTDERISNSRASDSDAPAA